MTTDNGIIEKVVKRWREAKRISAAVLRNRRMEDEHAQAEIALMIDHIRAEGYDSESVLGRSILCEMIQSRIPGEKEPRWNDGDGFPLDKGEL
jgi:hypothetical protein